ncbi:hypothetical protein GCM10007977_067830 [Dactylosporangium sucinum]|uniref:Uncharacterized protein n=1 Tax=Dactylosporangium sucinum TaxID=1424081 RepID=A0A917X2H3_9ACTN|nr:hypothetical protein GCM10007977_067830 [Dactylosporangium sucinum]
MEVLQDLPPDEGECDDHAERQGDRLQGRAVPVLARHRSRQGQEDRHRARRVQNDEQGDEDFAQQLEIHGPNCPRSTPIELPSLDDIEPCPYVATQQ